jgi:hypothetical protein
MLTDTVPYGVIFLTVFSVPYIFPSFLTGNLSVGLYSRLQANVPKCNEFEGGHETICVLEITVWNIPAAGAATVAA